MIHEFENINGVIHHRVFPSKEEMGPEGVEKIKRIAYRLLPGGYVDETGPHRGAPPTEEDFRWADFLTFHQRYLGDFANKAVFSREEVESMLKRGEISETRADELLHMSYETKEKKEDKQ